jgi:glycosyltransferase involved in cell wall biosynthesis
MRVLHVITRMNQGGTARWLDVLVSEQTRRGHDVTILAGQVQGAEVEDPVVSELPVINVPVLGRRISPARDLQAAWSLGHHFRRLKPDIINSHTSKAGALARAANLGLGPSRPAPVHTIHGHLLTGFAGPTGTFLIRETERALGSISDGLICVGPLAYEGVTAARIGRGRPVVDILPGARKLSLPRRSDARRMYGLAEQDFVVAWLGRLTRQKNPERALEVARLTESTKWLIAGDGEMQSQLRSAAPGNVRMLGWTDPAQVLAAADLYVHTADWEGFPYSVIEALQAGLRVVATDSVPPSPGVIRVTPGTRGVVAGIAEAVAAVRMAGPEPETIRWSRADLFTPEAFGQAHESIYRASRRHRSQTRGGSP